MWPLKSILYFCGFWAACLMALFNPIWGLLNYMFAYQTNPTNTWWGAPLESMGMRFSMLAAAATLLGLLLGQRRVPRARPSFTPWEWALLGILAISCLSLVLGVSFNHRSEMAWEKLWKMMLFVLILTRLGSCRTNLRLILWCLVTGSLYVGYDAHTAGPSAFLLGRLNRIGGPDFATTSGTAAHLSAMLPLIGTAFLIARRWPGRLLALVTAAFTVNAIIMCRTRSAFIGLAVGALIAVLIAPQTRRFRVYALLVCGSVMAFSLTDHHFWNRMQTLTQKETLEQDMATVSRTEIWHSALEILSDHPQGIGIGNFARVIGNYDPRYAKRSTHNTVIVCFVELGIHGGILFLWLTFSSLGYLYRSARLARDSHQPLETTWMAYGFLISFVTYFVTALGTERFYCESFWWVLALPVCLYRTVRSEARKEIGAGEVAQRQPIETSEPLWGAAAHAI